MMFVFLSVPIIATAIREELEIGSASSGDATCATNTVKHIQHVAWIQSCFIVRLSCLLLTSSKASLIPESFINYFTFENKRMEKPTGPWNT